MNIQFLVTILKCLNYNLKTKFVNTMKVVSLSLDWEIVHKSLVSHTYLRGKWIRRTYLE